MRSTIKLFENDKDDFMYIDVNWDSFKLYNQSAKGLRFKFEDLCRQLFANENLAGNKRYRHLHSSPNNPGLETEPVYDEVNKRWVGFQAKYFDIRADYTQIKDSANMVVKHYAGKLDHVFLFSNKELTTGSLTEVVGILNKANISLELITDNAILDLVRGKYPYLGVYYFGSLNLSQQWFCEKNKRVFDELGHRFNQEFNVDTKASQELSLFTMDGDAIRHINSKKGMLLERIKELFWKNTNYQSYLCKLGELVAQLPDINLYTIKDSFDWKEKIIAKTQDHIASISSHIETLGEEEKKLYQKAFNDSEHDDKSKEKYYAIRREIQRLEEIAELPSIIEVNERERQLILQNVIIISGEAGIGKSHLMANEMHKLMMENRYGLILSANIYFKNDPISFQIMNNLGIELGIDDFIDALETIGEINNSVVTVFIDALNETWNKQLWQTGLNSIVEKINSSPMVKLALSYRNEYEKSILPEKLLEKIKDGKTLQIHHRGFVDNSIEAIEAFFNHYSVPFTPLEYFSYELSNPLFLTLYCKTYSGEEVDLPSLYEKVIKHANKSIIRLKRFSEQGFTEDDEILLPLIQEIARKLIDTNKRSITRKDLIQLDFWKEYGIAPGRFIPLLAEENVIYDAAYDGNEWYYFSYDQMNDYYCAREIMRMHDDKISLKKYIVDKVLEIKDGVLGNQGNTDLFINLCAIYAEKYKEECIDIIDGITDDIDRNEIFSKYILSYQWRKSGSISQETFWALVEKYSCYPEDLWNMIVGNSIKVNNPINADYLHKILMRYKLNRRDLLWTLYVNGLTDYEGNRVVQLVELYNRGGTLEVSNDKQLELLLTLLAWLLTSSNRWLRDHTSKAMIEILKKNFRFCKKILEKFRDVNDPYVIQRLYGIVFGACCKREEKQNEYQSLAEYVYDNVFNKEKVYPDILLRDYARLIIEKFLYENPDYKGTIDKSRIVPTYCSDPIPEMGDKNYEKMNDEGLFWLIHSMRFEGMGMYGDFGRYVFQAALRSFEVDHKNIFNYAMDYILNELGYTVDYFGEYDRQCGGYDRFRTSKTERIGKKYQWIAMYNILARVSDHNVMKNGWYDSAEEVIFEGAWEPYVRDFDPTLNIHFMNCKEAPCFVALTDYNDNVKKEILTINTEDSSSKDKWLSERDYFIENWKERGVLIDSNGTQWISLSQIYDSGRRNLKEEKLLAWCCTYAYFMKDEQAMAFLNSLTRGESIISSDISNTHHTYAIFDREYPWSPSCKQFEEESWTEAHVKTGKKEIITETVSVPDFSVLDEYLQRISDYIDCHEDGKFDAVETLTEDIDPPEIPSKEVTREREVEVDIGKILLATTELLWEEEYDASKDEAISRTLPCGELINSLGLQQLGSDDFFYDRDGALAAFDLRITQGENCFVIRRDLLKSFLEDKGYKLVWLLRAGKEVHGEDLSISKLSEWEGVYIFNEKGIEGDIKMMENTY